MIVCLCRGVSDRVLRSVIAAGAATLDDVSVACGAGADCRSCTSALNRCIELCQRSGDNGSRQLLESILEAEEVHANWIEAQQALLQQAGEGNYLAQQIKE